MEGGGLGQKAIKLKNSVGSDAFALCFTDILKYNKTQTKSSGVAQKILAGLDKQLERRFLKEELGEGAATKIIEAYDKTKGKNTLVSHANKEKEFNEFKGRFDAMVFSVKDEPNPVSIDTKAETFKKELAAPKTAVETVTNVVTETLASIVTPAKVSGKAQRVGTRDEANDEKSLNAHQPQKSSAQSPRPTQPKNPPSPRSPRPSQPKNPPKEGIMARIRGFLSGLKNLFSKNAKVSPANNDDSLSRTFNDSTVDKPRNSSEIKTETSVSKSPQVNNASNRIVPGFVTQNNNNSSRNGPGGP